MTNKLWIFVDDVHELSLPNLKYLKGLGISYTLAVPAHIRKLDNLKLANISQIRELVGGKVSLASHGYFHSNPYSQEFDSFREIVLSKLALEKEFEMKVDTYAYPYSILNKEISEVVSKNYLYARGGWVDEPYESFIINDPQAVKYNLPCFTIKFWETDMFCDLLRTMAQMNRANICLGLHLISDLNFDDSTYPWRVTIQDMEKILNLAASLNIEVGPFL